MRLGAFLIHGLMLWSCAAKPDNDISVFNSSFDFNESSYDWSGGAADYSIKDTAATNFDLIYSTVPERIAPVQHSLKLSGTITGDYLTMFIKKQITGLRPETDYTLAFDIELVCDADSTAGQTIILKSGATANEPHTIKRDQRYRLNIDNGTYAENGVDMIVVDTVRVNSATNEYGVVQSGDVPSKYVFIKAQSDADGSLWIIIATESSGVGRSIVYYTKVGITFSAFNH